jgi:peptidyl-Lys metalloendopeptidase
MNKHYFRFIVVAAILAAMFLVVGSVGAAPKDGPVVSLSSAQSEYSASQDVLVTVTISNPTRHTVRILKWFTPSAGLEEPLFSIRMNGEPVVYTGAVYKRPPAAGSDYLSLKAGESVSYQVTLDDYYELSAAGQYEITFQAASYFLYSEKGNNAFSPDLLKSDPLSLKIEARKPAAKPTPTPTPPPSGRNSFKSCTTSQQSILVSARNQAKTYASNSDSYLLGINSGTQRYTEWFGAFTTARLNTVKSHFTALHTAWDNAGVNFDCGCKQNAYAYVYPNKPYFIYLCKVFWLAPLAGTDSQGGTLIHEMSHFYVVASTSDYVYGQTGARSLAITNPDNAVMNADNHEYFAENNPFKP